MGELLLIIPGRKAPEWNLARRLLKLLFIILTPIKVHYELQKRCKKIAE